MFRSVTIAEPLGHRMRRLRVEKGLTQAELAEPDYTAAYISTIEAGRRIPSPAAVAHFAARLQVDPEELATGRPTSLPAELRFRLQEGFHKLYSAEYPLAEKQFKEIAAAARPYAMARIAAQALVGLGIATERQGDPEAANEHFLEARDLLLTEPAPLWVEAVAGIARCAQQMGDVREAIHILETYLLVLKKNDLQEPLALMRAYSSLIWPYTEVGLFKKAREAAEEALRLEPRVEDPEQVANMHLNVARELLRQGRAEDALTSLQRSEDLYSTLNWRTELARAHGNRGIVFAEEGNMQAARKELGISLELIKETPDALTQARSLNELARVERLADNPVAAIEMLNEAFELLKDGDVAELALTHLELARCHTQTNAKQAEENYLKAIELYTKVDKAFQAATAYRELGDLLSDQGDLDRGRSAYRQGLVSVETV